MIIPRHLWKKLLYAYLCSSAESFYSLKSSRFTLISARYCLNRSRISQRVILTSVSTPNFGETGGAVFVLNDGLLCRGDADLIDNMEWTVLPNERIGLVGPNGAGKSSLLTVIAGTQSLEVGSICVKSGTRIGYLIQKGVSGSTRTVYDEASSQMNVINGAALEVEAAMKAVDQSPNDPSLLNNLNDAQARFEAAGGNTQQKTVSQVLNGLGFSSSDQNRLCSEFSGGWQMRISLARLLLSDSDLLLLDEPTNHLDSSSKAWLGKYLGEYEGTIIVVSHDEDLLRKMSLTGVAEVRDGQLEVYKGCSYDAFIKERVQRAKRAASLYESEQQERARLQQFVDRFGATATKASAAQSRAKRIARIDQKGTPPPPSLKAPKTKLKLIAPPICHRDILELRNAEFGFEGGPIVLSGVNLKLEKGMRLAVLGPNGVGKSTLLKALTGDLSLKRGERIVGEGASIGVFTQDLAQDLPQDSIALNLVLELARSSNPGISDEEARDVLGALGLAGNKALRKVGMLSGGEKARVALAIFALVPRNVLLLDEPSNHLDQHTLAALIDAIRRWKGTIICVSHNSNFIDSVKPSHTAIVRNGTLEFHNRPPEERDWLSFEMGTTPVKKVSQQEDHLKVEAEIERKRSKQRVNAPVRILKIESLVENLELEISEIDEKMYRAGSNAGLAMELMENRLIKQKKVDELYLEWEQLEDMLNSE